MRGAEARNCCQLATACSTGASARDMMIDAAIIAPGEISLRIAR